jgi:maltose-binding protein MalE
MKGDFFMNRRIAAFTIAAVAVLGLTACSGSPSSTDGSSTKSDSSTSAQNTDQSVADACTEAGAKVQAASQELSSLDVSAAAADPQGTVDAFSKTVDAIGAAAESVGNPEVKAAVGDVYDDFGALRDVLSKVLIDQDTAAASDMTTIMADVQESSTALSTLCAG